MILVLSDCSEHFEGEVFWVQRLKRLIRPVVALNIAKEDVKTLLLCQKVAHCSVLAHLCIPQQRLQEFLQLRPSFLDHLLASVEEALLGQIWHNQMIRLLAQVSKKFLKLAKAAVYFIRLHWLGRLIKDRHDVIGGVGLSSSFACDHGR